MNTKNESMIVLAIGLSLLVSIPVIIAVTYAPDESTDSEKRVQQTNYKEVNTFKQTRMTENLLTFINTGQDTFKVSPNCNVRFIDYLELWRSDPVDDYGNEVNEVYIICDNEPFDDEIQSIYLSIHESLPFSTIVPYGVDHLSDWKSNFFEDCIYGFEKIVESENSYKCVWTGEDYWNHIKCIGNQCFYGSEEFDNTQTINDVVLMEKGNYSIQFNADKYDFYKREAKRLCEDNGYDFYQLALTSFCHDEGVKFLEIPYPIDE